ncbi:aspartate/tyrosine/aromatic aminotransferase [Devosia sp. MC532]|uniref:amino acid aminotransferase n=1 Tax=Devosia sp. MC532 TaxID=2799788 RepID=UPI0018F7114E|nr:amino acid aminotransferase [Devosia sp. MC532]MBJ7577478.1 aspartate/tyrosine/aromatic aminotransferase [Devosia sp. MC532]
MFETLTQAPSDKILALMGEYAADQRSSKIDLGVGVYKDEKGVTPVMTSVRKAEERILSNEKTKTYLGIAGNKGFGAAVLDLIFEDGLDRSRVRIAQTPGGTGSLWVLMQLITRARPGASFYVSDPTWANHVPMAKQAGFDLKTYPYFDTETRGVKFEEMLATLNGLKAGDVVLLHGCCHNPTGANLTPAQWDQVADSLVRTGALPFIDLAYLGFGDGIEADAYGTRKVIAAVPEAVLAFSGSKNFGLYKERVGAAILVARNAAEADIANSQMLNVVRGAYSQPPDHGAEVIRTILTDAALRAEWETELTEMRNRMIYLREKLSAAIRERSNSTDFDFVSSHRGMFSLLGLTNEAVEKLKQENGVYMTGDSRINVAGLPEAKMGELADAILAVSR